MQPSLMPVIWAEMDLTKVQIGNMIIASVAITIIARLVVGWVCETIGPRRTYTWLLVLSAIPVIGVGLATDYTSLLLWRLAIGVIGASFVITQYHTSLVFAPNVVRTANATTAGWGNLGGGVTQMVMPLILAFFVGTMGLPESTAWRLAMVVPGVLLLVLGVGYFLITRDTLDGDFAELRARGRMEPAGSGENTFVQACRDYRVWALFILYAACFSVEAWPLCRRGRRGRVRWSVSRGRAGVR